MTRERKFVTGTRVRLKRSARTMSGWHGNATILYPDIEVPIAIMDGSTDFLKGQVYACNWQWAIMRDQTPNPDHAAVIAECEALPST